MKVSQAPVWNRETLQRSPLFAPLHPLLDEIGADDFPSVQEINGLLAALYPPVTVQNGKRLRFVAQQPGKLRFEDQYEPRCYLKGEVQTRSNNLHDLFNSLVWMTFPKTKAILNARHYDAMLKGRASGNTSRGSVRDVNTLFDESGVIVVYSDKELAYQLRGFKWKELFWHRREQASAGLKFYIFGHALYEKALQPYVGMTGQGLLLATKPVFFDWPLDIQLAHLDGILAEDLVAQNNFRSTRDLAPVPLLGIPGWDANNEFEAFYDNTQYFRSGRRN